MILLPAIYLSQNVEERKKITNQSDQLANAQLLQDLTKNENERLIRVSNYLSRNPTVKKMLKDDDTGKIELTDIQNGEPIYTTTYNDGAAKTARATALYSGGSLGLNVQGEGMTVGVWDGGPVRDSHQEFIVGGFTKVSVLDFGASMSNHATHVAGTIAAQGILPSVRGVAFKSSIKSYYWDNDLAEMLPEAQGGMVVSNHSYGPLLTSSNQLWLLGAYNNDARQLDVLCYNNPYYLPVFAAGNSRNDTTVPYSTQIATKSGYDLIASDAVAKNALTVAAVNQVDSYVNNEDVVMSTFSSYGPTDDGRIKPEISTKGVNVRSTLSSSDTATGFDSGTSMASPGVTGVVTLLQQYHNQLYSNFMRSATVKGLILHTADEAGNFPGPDYSFGWGLINAENSAKIIRDKNLTTNRSVIEEQNLVNGTTFTKTINATSSRPLKISISWTDPAPPPNDINNPDNINTGTVDPPTKYLVNDLDIKVTSSTGTVYYPWKLQGMSNFSGSATNNSTNDVDNFERVDIPNPSGTYTITVTHKGSLTNGNQNFTLIANSQNLSTLNTVGAIKKEDQIQIYPNPVDDILYVKNNNLVEAQVVILDVSGRMLIKETIKDSKIDVQSLEPGNYMLLYKDKKEREISLKFIKK